MRIPIHVSGATPAEAPVGAVRVGVPLPRGSVGSAERLVAVDESGRRLPTQGRALALWPDRTVKWALVDLAARLDDRDRQTVWLVERDEAASEEAVASEPLQTVQTTRGIVVRSGAVEFELPTRAEALIASVRIGGVNLLSGEGVRIELKDPAGVLRTAKINRLAIEHAGPVRVDVIADGCFDGLPQCPLEFRARLAWVVGLSRVACEFRIRNPRPAQHVGGLWDLGDEGSWAIGDLSIRVVPGGPVEALEWCAEPRAEPRRIDPTAWCLYQDSSGGEHWDSPNHVDARGKPAVRFRGYEVRIDTPGTHEVVLRGERAQPTLAACSGERRVAVSVDDFWENFPKALRWSDGALEVGLFPSESAAPAELQGGEQKRHRFWIDFGASQTALAPYAPAHAWVEPSWVEASGAVHGLTVDLDAARESADYTDQIVEGPDSFVARREWIDEYGWRNFGDLYADHEAINHPGPEPFVSHYNNQYDFVLGAGVHALRTGDPRWWRLMQDAARHTVDIDIYHTHDDRPAFNGGLFWHSDHYLPAMTATHRTYSRYNATGADYGGGPGNEHNYASGLLLHHYVTGDPDSREAVIGLADWVLAMDDGERTLLGMVDPGPTGAASVTLEPDYHGPGRGPGNSISTLLDAYALTRNREYMAKAEELVQRCIHPADDIVARRLDEPERRWSYLVFLQVLGKYLDVKRELGEIDYCFQYARESLLHYAEWMLGNEVPYREVLHKVELPTETWSAHDIRKCHVLHLAACYDDRGLAAAFRERATFFYERCLGDLATFATRSLTRPLVILCVYGHLHAYYRRIAMEVGTGPGRWFHAYDFGAPRVFVAQRTRMSGVFRRRLETAWREGRRILKDRARRWRRRRGAAQ